MQIKRVRCPKCGVTLEVKNSKNEIEKLVTCPKCKTPLKISFPPQQEPLEAPTIYGTSTSNEDGATQLGGGLSDATVIGGNMNGSTQLVIPSQKSAVLPRLLFEGDIYTLRDGKNVIGRKAQTSQATVQIDTDDRYMSRLHSMIMITSLPDGSKKATLSNYQNKNKTIVDGQEICTGDEIRLTDGDSITMGHTTIVFKLS